MSLVYDNTRTAKQGGGYIERPDAAAFYSTELPDLRAKALADHARSVGRWKTADKFAYAAAAVPFAAMAAPALSTLWSGAAAEGGAGSVNGMALTPYAAPAAMHAPAVGLASAPGATSSLGRLGSIFNSKGAELGVNSALSLVGMHSQNKANDQARVAAAQSEQRQIALQLKQIAELKENNILDRAQAKELADREYALQQRGVQLQEDAQKYQQGQDAARETRLAPYRQISVAAAQKLASLWGL